MEVTSLQELAPCQEQIRLHKNHRVLPCQAVELWGKNEAGNPACIFEEVLNCADINVS